LNKDHMCWRKLPNWVKGGLTLGLISLLSPLIRIVTYLPGFSSSSPPKIIEFLLTIIFVPFFILSIILSPIFQKLGWPQPIFSSIGGSGTWKGDIIVSIILFLIFFIFGALVYSSFKRFLEKMREKKI